MQKVRIGVIGAGGIACSIHLPLLAAMAEAELSAVCDYLPGRALEAAKRFGIPGISLSYHEMLAQEKLDAVFVLVPPDGLFRAASDCLLAGKHVFMEKPMGISAFQAKSLREIAASQRRILHTGFNRRFIPAVREIVREFCKVSTITRVEGCFYKNSSPSFYGGCASSFICDVIHVIDLVRHLASGGAGKISPVTEAATLETDNPQTHIAEAWYSSMRFENGVTGGVRANYRTGGRVHQFEIHGPGASAFINLGFGEPACSGKILRSQGPGTHSLSAAGAGGQELAEFDGIKIAGSDVYADYYGYRDEDRLFIQTVQENREAGDPARAAEDCSSMELAEYLLGARVKTGPC
ncbi:MAG: Gfo/Idh/MocA family oxidoreductase [Treponema sp.]|jgi:predicted dehydrogenase|nr:Gfo/Idh/MocA family oxidoreductase [Treponema sp.]